MKINPDKKITSGSQITETKNRSIRFLVADEERMRIEKEGFYVDDRLVARDLEIYEAFKDWLTQETTPHHFGETKNGHEHGSKSDIRQQSPILPKFPVRKPPA